MCVCLSFVFIRNSFSLYFNKRNRVNGFGYLLTAGFSQRCKIHLMPNLPKISFVIVSKNKRSESSIFWFSIVMRTGGKLMSEWSWFVFTKKIIEILRSGFFSLCSLFRCIIHAKEIHFARTFRHSWLDDLRSNLTVGVVCGRYFSCRTMTETY